jgi:branched-chain amino acid transport system substrate-binding protein
LGGKVLDGIGYNPPTGDFAASLHRINFIFWEQDLRALDSKVSQAVQQYGPNKVGVYIVSFDEIVPIMIQAERHPNLAAVKWYGSDGSALNANLVRNFGAADFADKTSFVNPIYAVDDENNSGFQRVEHQITEDIGHPHRSYAELAYDALWVAALTSDQTNNQTDSHILSKNLVKTANSYNGITGKIILNAEGDRAVGSYDFWAITKQEQGANKHDGVSNSNSGGLEWTRVKTFHNVHSD